MRVEKHPAYLPGTDGHADLVALGRLFISNSDLPGHLSNQGPLTPYDCSTFYGATDEAIRTTRRIGRLLNSGERWSLTRGISTNGCDGASAASGTQSGPSDVRSYVPLGICLWPKPGGAY